MLKDLKSFLLNMHKAVAIVDVLYILELIDTLL